MATPLAITWVDKYVDESTLAAAPTPTPALALTVEPAQATASPASSAERFEITDRAMAMLRAVGEHRVCLAPRSLRSPVSAVVYPARPTVVTREWLVEIDDRIVAFADKHGRLAAMTTMSRADCSPERARACRPLVPPRVVSLRALRRGAGFVLVVTDERIGKPILSIGLLAGGDPSRDFAVEWRPDGYDPPWLAKVARTT